MKIYTLHREQFLPISIEKAWEFFSTPKNLSKITPKEMMFKITSEGADVPIYTGMHISYIVKPMLGIPLKWVTEITAVDAPQKFTDTQLKGPYALWEHTHIFKWQAGGVMMTDDLKYALPLGFLGNIAHALFVKDKLEGIFDYRVKVLKEMFV